MEYKQEMQDNITDNITDYIIYNIITDNIISCRNVLPCIYSHCFVSGMLRSVPPARKTQIIRTYIRRTYIRRTYKGT